MGERKGKGESMELANFEELFKDFPESKFTGMVSLRMSIGNFNEEIRTDFMEAVKYMYEIQGFVWGIYTAGMIDADRRGILINEITEATRGWTKKGTKT